jgi:hypothetical protein
MRAIPIIILLTAVLALAYIIQKPVEAFGSTSPGTLTQLSANRVATATDVAAYREWLAQRDRDIKAMTEADLSKGGQLWPIMRIGAYA